LPLLALVLVGCGQAGPARHLVTGTVRYEGKPLPLGTVVFVPEQGPMSGPVRIGQDGRYQLEAVAGRHAVAVTAMPPRTGGRPDPHAEGGIDWTGVPEVKSLIPEKYNRYETSELTAVVEPKDNTIDLDLRPN
jgi:hypothetical protein